jgi:hypothetical protein
MLPYSFPFHERNPNRMMMFRPSYGSKILVLLLCFVAGLSALVGCSNSAQYGTLTVTTDYPAGITLQLQTQTDQAVFQTVQSVVLSGPEARFARLTPGEYRLVAVDASGQTLQEGASFGAGIGETTMTFDAPASSGSA